MSRLVLAARGTLFRIPLRSFSSSSSSSSFVPPASLTEDHQNDDLFLPQPTLQRPPNPTFYTTRSDYYEVIGGLQDAIHATRTTLKSLHLFPLPKFALDALPAPQPAWADRADMGTELGVSLSASMYRQLVLALKELELYHRIAQSAGISDLEASLANLVGSFESTKQVEARDRRRAKQEMMGKRAPLDAYGRSYTVGRRKTSTARVWMIKAHDPAPGPGAAKSGTVAGADDAHTASTSVSTLLSPVAKAPSPPTTSVLVNAAPISTYFPLPADRDAALRPLKLTGLLGAYNVFALVRGGGTSGQSGALALAIARACVAHAPDVEHILRKADLMKRDPRMVERKKTGLAKARKAYTWVKR